MLIRNAMSPIKGWRQRGSERRKRLEVSGSGEIQCQEPADCLAPVLLRVKSGEVQRSSQSQLEPQFHCSVAPEAFYEFLNLSKNASPRGGVLWSLNDLKEARCLQDSGAKCLTLLVCLPWRPWIMMMEGRTGHLPLREMAFVNNLADLKLCLRRKAMLLFVNADAEPGICP